MSPLHIIALALAALAVVLVLCQTFGRRGVPDFGLLVLVALVASCTVAGGAK